MEDGSIAKYISPRVPTDMCAQVNVQAPAGTEKSEGGINKIEKLPTKDEKEEKPSKDELDRRDFCDARVTLS